MNYDLKRLNRSLRSGFIEVFGRAERDRFERESQAHPENAESELFQIAAYFRDRLTASEVQGALISIGKFAYPYLKNEFSAELGFRDAKFRILPIGERIQTGLSRLVDSVLAPGGIPTELTETDAAFRVALPESRPAEPTDPLSIAFLSGVILECCAELSGGKTYRCETENRRELRLFKKPIGH